MGVNYNTRTVTNGLVAYWDAANIRSYPGSGTTWFDLSGNGNHGTLRNSPTYSSDNYGKFVFDGISQDVDCGNDASINFGTGNFSVSVWFRRFTNATTNLRLLSKAAAGDAAGDAGFAFYGYDTSAAFTINPSGTRSAITTGIGYSLNQWVNAVGLIERSGQMRTYKNGVLTGSTTAPAGSVSGSINLYLGSNKGTNLFWSGEIAIVSLHNKALSAAEVLQNYNAQKGRFGL